MVFLKIDQEEKDWQVCSVTDPITLRPTLVVRSRACRNPTVLLYDTSFISPVQHVQ